MLSFIIPTLNDGHRLGPTLERITFYEAPKEIIISDGGSNDKTFSVTAKAGGKFYMSPLGRGPQLAAGANAAIGDWLLFLHADTKLGPGWMTAVNRFIENPDNRFRVGYFTFALDDPSPQARMIERLVDWRCKTFSLPYGDQGLLISRALYDKLGGFKPIPLMEDVDLVRRIQNHRLEMLPALAITSADRYRKDGFFLRPLRNLFCLLLFLVGVSPQIIADIYQ